EDGIWRRRQRDSGASAVGGRIHGNDGSTGGTGGVHSGGGAGTGHVGGNRVAEYRRKADVATRRLAHPDRRSASDAGGSKYVTAAGIAHQRLSLQEGDRRSSQQIVL